ncbi:MAG: rRNA pseudouridine synthase [Lachnospiraceae bacterium]|nr:rRNA pseudouridine synthase [Lachnospiraceae bacterium]
MSDIRLDKFLADAGAGTRSEVKIKIKKGQVTVNGEAAGKSDIKINPDIDEVCLDGKKLIYNEFEYFMLNKPQGVVSATKDDKDKTVIELITEAKRRDLFPVGRLDKDTEGLLIITNDGKLSNNLLAPGKHVDKTYFAIIAGEVTDDTVLRFTEGIDIGDDKPTAPAKLRILYDDKDEILDVDSDATNNNSGNVNNIMGDDIIKSNVEITITEGRYHQIKRMFEAVGMKVTYLKRLSMGSLSLDDSLKPGEYRRLTDEEIRLLAGDF